MIQIHLAASLGNEKRRPEQLSKARMVWPGQVRIMLFAKIFSLERTLQALMMLL